MWFSEGKSQAAELKFFQAGFPSSNSPSKSAIFNGAVNGTHPGGYVYKVAAIDQLITYIQADNKAYNGVGIQMYFGSYHSTNAPTDFSMGSTIDKQVILIFSGTAINPSTGTPNYYVISPVDQQAHKIPNTMKNDWCNYFYANEDNPTGLPSTLQPNAPENQSSGVPTDTRSIYYDTSSFVDFLQRERKYQDTNRINNPSKIVIDQIGIYFAAYPNTGIGANPHSIPPTSLKNRLFVIYEFMRGGQIFFIDDAADFCQRQGSPCYNTNVKLKLKRGRVVYVVDGGNNGQLCPPSCQ
jgi:hypothetical protein